jgi:pimeloyl-ACP methyl ester carboxylesterase
VLWGRNDKLIPLACGEYYADQIPKAELQVVEECGHMLPFEKVDEFVDRTMKFILTP